MNETRRRIRSANGTAAIYSKMNYILAMRPRTEIIFDIGKEQLYNIQFNNGVFDMKKRQFRKRTKEDYVTKCLTWNFQEKCDKKAYNIVRDFFKKIQPDDEMRNFVAGWLAYCLTGSTKRELFKMNIGRASNGKSTEFDIHATCFDIYSKKMNSSTFAKDYQKRHKEYYSLLTEPVRFAYMEEMKTNRVDIDEIKDFVTGKNISCEVMYGTKINGNIQAKLTTCANKEPSTDIDEGILRRGLLQHYTSTFADVDEDDEENYIYRKDVGFTTIFQNDDVKNAYFHYLMEHYNENFAVPEKCREAFKQMCEDGDDFSPMVNECFEITGNEGHRISKDMMMEFVGKPLKMEWRAVLTECKRIGLKYKGQKRYNGKQGCFVGIRQNDHEEDVEDI
jgi:hypothetical protein